MICFIMVFLTPLLSCETIDPASEQTFIFENPLVAFGEGPSIEAFFCDPGYWKCPRCDHCVDVAHKICPNCLTPRFGICVASIEQTCRKT